MPGPASVSWGNSKAPSETMCHLSDCGLPAEATLSKREKPRRYGGAFKEEPDLIRCRTAGNPCGTVSITSAGGTSLITQARLAEPASFPSPRSPPRRLQKKTTDAAEELRRSRRVCGLQPSTFVYFFYPTPPSQQLPRRLRLHLDACPNFSTQGLSSGVERRGRQAGRQAAWRGGEERGGRGAVRCRLFKGDECNPSTGREPDPDD